MDNKMNSNAQAVFMTGLEALKEYAKVNGNIVTKEDVLSYFKDMDIDDAKLNMIYGYLLANSITVSGQEDIPDIFVQEFEKNDSEPSEVKSLLTDEDYKADEVFLEMYMQDLKKQVPLSRTTQSMLLVNIVEDNDKESLALLSESFLPSVLKWTEEYKRKGVLYSDIVQEANLAMMAYVSEKRFLNNYEWKDKIKEGTNEDLLKVLEGIEEDIRSEISGAIGMLIDEQLQMDEFSGQVLNKVNLVNDWVKRLKEELQRKPTVDEVAVKMGVSKEKVIDAVRFSADSIEDIDMGN